MRLLDLRKTKSPKTRESGVRIEISKGFWSNKRRRDSEMGSVETD